MRCFQPLGNRVKRPLRAEIVSSSIPCARLPELGRDFAGFLRLSLLPSSFGSHLAPSGPSDSAYTSSPHLPPRSAWARREIHLQDPSPADASQRRTPGRGGKPRAGRQVGLKRTSVPAQPPPPGSSSGTVPPPPPSDSATAMPNLTPTAPLTQ